MVAAVVCAVALGHFATPAGLHGWHWVHILLQKLFYLPILMAAAWFGLRGTLLTAGAVSSFFMVHVLLDWGGYRMAQADQIGEIASFWVIALTSSLLFRRERRALEETAEAHRETITALASSLDLRERRGIPLRVWRWAPCCTTDRPYKAALSYRSAADMIARESAVHFDPEAVEAFLKIPFGVLLETARRYGVILREV